MDASKQTKALSWFCRAVTALLVIALLAGVMLPVYSDEVGWRFQERAAFDGVDKLYSEICGPNTLARPPFFMWPARYYSAVFNSAFADPLYVRLSGILYALAWLVLLLLLIRRIAADTRQKSVLTIIGLGLMSLGTMPLLLVWSRPEQPLLLAATAALLLAWSDWREPLRLTFAREAWLRSAGILALAIVAMSYHIKGVFLVPLFLTCLWFSGRGRAAHAPRLTAAALLTIAGGIAAFYWIGRLQCPGDPALKEEFAYNNTGALLVGARDLNQFLAVAGKLIANLNPLAYAGLTAPRPDPLSAWLPEDQIAKADSFCWFLALLCAWTLSAGCGLAALVHAAFRALRARRLDPRATMAGVLLVTVLGWSATQQVRNVYEAIFVLPLAMLAIVFALSCWEVRQQRLGPWINVATGLMGIGALVSPLLIAWIYAPSLIDAAGQRGYIAAQRYSVPHFHYHDVKSDILATARQCGIDDPSRARVLMIDDTTYFALMQAKLPQHWIGILPRPKSIPDPVAYLKSRGSGGMVLGCHLLPPQLRARAKQQGQFCCLGPPAW